jgi:transcriptional regulator with XRE-family HTH domain
MADDAGGRRRSTSPWRVFLSHTAELGDSVDGRSFVAAAEAAVIRAGHAVTDMAYFTARDHEPADYCEGRVADADVYVGIVGHRYGTPVRGQPALSYTELEYEAASTLGLPRLVFLLSEGHASKPSDSQPTEHRARQQAFRQRLRDEAGVTVALVATPADLEIRLYQALVELRQDPPSPPRYPQNRLRKLRGSHTQEEMAELASVTTTTYRNWERGRTRPLPHSIRDLCRIHGVQEHELGFDSPPDTAAHPLQTARYAETILDPTTAVLPTQLLTSGMLEGLASISGMLLTDVQGAVARRAVSVGSDAPAAIARSTQAAFLLDYYDTERLARFGLRPYAFVIEGQTVATTVVGRPGWFGQSIPLNIGAGRTLDEPAETCRWHPNPPPPFIPATPEVVDQAVDRLARSARPDNTVVMSNKPLYRLLDLSFGNGALDATFGLDWFAHYALTYDLLERELAEALAHQQSSLPLRGALLPDSRAVVEYGARLCAGGFGALFAIARRADRAHPRDFLLVAQRRSSRVLNVSGKLAVMPKGFHQHLVDPAGEVEIGMSMRRELEEELFGRVDLDEDAGRPRLSLAPYHDTASTVPMRWLLERQACTFDCTAVGLNLLAGNYDFFGLIATTNEEFWDRFAASCMPNWEAESVQTYSSMDATALASLILDPLWTDESLVALVEGLRCLAERYPDRVRLPHLETPPCV